MADDHFEGYFAAHLYTRHGGEFIVFGRAVDDRLPEPRYLDGFDFYGCVDIEDTYYNVYGMLNTDDGPSHGPSSVATGPHTPSLCFIPGSPNFLPYYLSHTRGIQFISNRHFELPPDTVLGRRATVVDGYPAQLEPYEIIYAAVHAQLNAAEPAQLNAAEPAQPNAAEPEDPNGVDPDSDLGWVRERAWELISMARNFFSRRTE